MPLTPSAPRPGFVTGLISSIRRALGRPAGPEIPAPAHACQDFTPVTENGEESTDADRRDSDGYAEVGSAAHAAGNFPTSQYASTCSETAPSAFAVRITDCDSGVDVTVRRK